MAHAGRPRVPRCPEHDSEWVNLRVGEFESGSYASVLVVRIRRSSDELEIKSSRFPLCSRVCAFSQIGRPVNNLFCIKMLCKHLPLLALAAYVVAHDNHEQIPVEGPHKSLWYNTLPGDGGTQVRTDQQTPLSDVY